MSGWTFRRDRGRHAAAQRPLEAAPVDQQRLAATFVELADTLADDFDPIDFLYALVDRCVELLDVTAVGLMLGDGRGRLRVMAASTEEMRMLELFQLQNHQGPCLECYRTGKPVDHPDLAAAEQRWPRFAPEAVRAGFGAVHAVPMRLRENTVGALNLFHARAGALREDHTRIAQALVDVATIGLIQVQVGRRQEVLLDQLERALDTRQMIEQAKGVLAERRGSSPAEALIAMREHGRAAGRGLSAIAHAVAENEPSVAQLCAGALGATRKATIDGG